MDLRGGRGEGSKGGRKQGKKEKRGNEDGGWKEPMKMEEAREGGREEGEGRKEPSDDFFLVPSKEGRKEGKISRKEGKKES